jgi:antitoxin CptB
MSDLDRLRWGCRRGLLELDLILQAFLERHLERLDPGQRQALRDLLDVPDPVLLDWVLGRDEPVDARYAGMVQLLRAG